MSANSSIEWTDHTYNPWWGCTKVSPGCDNCYASTLSTRYGFDVWGPDAPRRFFGDSHWAEPLKWNRDAEKAGARRRVFCGSMCDWAEGRPDQAEARARLFALIEATPWLDWQLLTKRPGAIPHLVPSHWMQTPPANVWYGTSVEDQEQADRRIPQLLKVPAVVRFLSCEPLLGPVELRPPWNRGLPWLRPDGISWVITGGESGPGARPGHVDWYRGLRDQCLFAGVAFNFKQWGEWIAAGQVVEYPTLDGKLYRWPDGAYSSRIGKKKAGRLLDGVEWSEFPQVTR